MIKLIIGLLFPFFFVPAFSQIQSNKGNASAFKGIMWDNELSWKQIIAKAKLENKKIFVDVYATWCGPCKKMDHEVYTNKKVGDFFNKEYISIQLQIDTSKVDNKSVEKKYVLAKEFKQKYNLAVLPTFLFFDSSGELVHKGEGFQEPNDFLEIGKEALNPHLQYYTLIKKMENEKLPHSILLKLDSIAAEFNDKTTQIRIAKQYINSYLAKLPDSLLMVRANITYVGKNRNLLTPSDKLFKYFLFRQKEIDSIVQRRGYAQSITSSIIFDFEFMPLMSAKKEPDWDRICKIVSNKYGSQYVEQNLLQTKINWFKKNKEWGEYIKYLILKVNGSLPNSINADNLMAMAYYTNNAEDVFLLSSNRNDLNSAIKWMDLVLNAGPQDLYFFYEGKANLLYKIGNLSEAISLANRGLEGAKLRKKENKDDNDNSIVYMENLIIKMKEGVSYKKLPVYVNEINRFK